MDQISNILKMKSREGPLSKNVVISRHALGSWSWKWRKDQNALKLVAVASPRQQILEKKNTAKLGLGLNFTVNVEFCFCAQKISIKKPEDKNVIFAGVQWGQIKTVLFVFVQFPKMILCKNRQLSGAGWVPEFGQLTSHCLYRTYSLVDIRLFDRLRKVRFLNFIRT